MRILNGGTNITTFKSFQILHLISLWVESWLISICGVAITSFPRSKKEAPRIRGAPRSRLSYPAFLSVEGSGGGKKRTDQIWFPQLPVNLGRRLLYHGMEWTVRRWFQGHVFKGLTLRPAHIQQKTMSNQIQKYGTRKLFGNDWQMESDQRVVWGNFIPGNINCSRGWERHFKTVFKVKSCWETAVEKSSILES